MAQTAGGTYYAASSELVSSWPATSLDLANQLESRFAAKAPLSSPTFSGITAVRATTADQYGATVHLEKSRNAAIVQNGDNLGIIGFRGYSGSTYQTAGYVAVDVDGTPGSGTDMPGRMIFATTADGTNTPSERMRIDNQGFVLVATNTLPTNAGKMHVGGRFSCEGLASHAGSAGAFQNNTINMQWNGSALRGWVDTVDLGTFSFTSDYRLKHAVADADAAWDRVKGLRPVTFRWKDEGIFTDDGVTHEGFIAHEVAEQIPSAVNYGKDEVNADGEPQYQSLNVSEIVPVLTKALQEAMARIEVLEAKVAALEAK